MKQVKTQVDFEKMASTRSSMKIGEVSLASGIGIEALRFYERNGLTGSEALSYFEVAEILSEVLEKPIIYRNPSIIGFVWRNWRKHKNLFFVFVMTIIYTTARFGQAGFVSQDLPKLLKRKAIAFRQFAEDYKDCWI